MKVYLAARYSRRVELCGYRTVLESMGIEVTARWLNGEHQALDADLLVQPDLSARLAREDFEDIERATHCISFTEAPRTAGASRGGRHVEFGIAYQMGLTCWIVGPAENVFHHLRGVRRFDRWLAAAEHLRYLKSLEHAAPRKAAR